MKKFASKLFVSLAGLGLAMIPVSCQKSEDPTDEVSAPSADASDPSPPSDTLVIFNWEEYIAQSVLDAFQEETGIEVVYETFENTIELKARMQSSPGQYDIVVADDVSLRELAELKMIDPINRDVLENFSNIDSRYLSLHSDPGNRYTVPYLWGSTLIAYRTDLVGDVTPSWASFFDASHGLKVGLLDEMVEAYASALLARGYSLNSSDATELSEASDLIRQWAAKGDIEVGDLYSVLDALDEGEVAMVMTYSGDAAAYADENELIDYVIPEEGAALWLDSFAIAADAEHKDAAYKFIDFMLRPQVAAENAAELWYATPNKAAVAHLDQEFLEDTAIWPTAEILERCAFHAETTADRDVTISKGMKYVMDEVRRKRSHSTVGQADSSDESTEE